MATTALWARSYFRHDALRYCAETLSPKVRRAWEWRLQCDRGCIVWQREAYEQWLDAEYADWAYRHYASRGSAPVPTVSYLSGSAGALRLGPISTLPPQLAHFGFVYSNHSNGAGAHHAMHWLQLSEVAIPLWLIIVAGLLPGFVTLAKVRWRRHRDQPSGEYSDVALAVASCHG